MPEAGPAMAPMFSLAGRVALVSGGAGLYGRPIVEALSSAGAHVIVASRHLGDCQAVADTLVASGRSASATELDLASEESIREVVRTSASQYGHIDVLVNNAVARAGGTMDDTSSADWELTSRVNSLGLFLMTKFCASEMEKQHSGSIINIASIYGVVGPHFGLYDGTDLTMPAFYSFDKGGMISFTRYLAAFYAKRGIRANCISPGGLLSGSQPSAFVRRYEAEVPLGRLATFDDIKGPVVFLASDAARYVTGVNLPVDGGWTAI